MIINIKQSKGNYSQQLDTGIKIKITKGKSRNSKGCQLTLSKQAKQINLGKYAQVLFDTEANQVILKAGVKSDGYRIQDSAPHIRFTLTEHLKGEIGDESIQEITLTKDSITFSWPSTKPSQINSKPLPEIASVTYPQESTQSPNSQARAATSQNKTQKLSQTQEVYEVIKKSKTPITLDEITKQLPFNQASCYTAINKLMQKSQIRSHRNPKKLKSELTYTTA